MYVTQIAKLMMYFLIKVKTIFKGLNRKIRIWKVPDLLFIKIRNLILLFVFLFNVNIVSSSRYEDLKNDKYFEAYPKCN